MLLALLGSAGSGLAEAPASPAMELARSSPTPAMEAVLQDVYERNPELAAARAEAQAAAEQAPQRGTLPDPTLGLAAFLLPPETRTGPQRLSATVGQRVPWKGKLSLREAAADQNAASLAARVEELALRKITQARSLIVRLAFQRAARHIVEEDLSTLDEFEGLARARYAAGRTTAQAAIKIQAEITRDRTRLLDIDQREASLLASINALRKRPPGTPVETDGWVDFTGEIPATQVLVERANTKRPILKAVRKQIARRNTEVDLARKDYKPDFTFGLSYTFVDNRQDGPGRLQPPPDNGDDILGVAATINLPIRKRRLDAGFRESHARLSAAASRLADAEREIDRQIDDLTSRLPLVEDQWVLFRDVLLLQAREALASIRSGYETGRADVLDLLDAERVLLAARLGELQAQTDHRVQLVELEGAIAGPLTDAAKPVQEEEE